MQSVTSSPPYSAGNWQVLPVTDSRVALVAAEGAGKHGNRLSSGGNTHAGHPRVHGAAQCLSPGHASHPNHLQFLLDCTHTGRQCCSPVLGEKTGSSSAEEEGVAGASEAAVMLVATAS